MAYYESPNLAEMYANEVQNRTKMQYNPVSEVSMPQYQYADEINPEVSNRGDAWSDLIYCLTSPLLRVGLLLQLSVLIFGFAFYYGHGGTGVFTFDLFSTPENLRTNESYNATLILLESIFLVGCICIALFQNHVADNSKLTRGFRSGSKLLATATTLDIFVIALRLMQSIYAYRFLANRWWMKYTQSNADWCLFFFGALIHSVSLALYGMAIFYMEAYHDEGTFEEWSWIIFALFSTTALFGKSIYTLFYVFFLEMLMVFTGFGNFFTVIHTVTLAVVLIWAFSFEPLLHYHSPVFHDRDLNSNVAFESLEDDNYNVAGE